MTETAASPPVPHAWPELLASLLDGRDLSAQQTSWAMDQVMSGQAPPVSLAAFLVALGAKGETVGELSGLADSMLAHARTLDVPRDVLDIVGTGGDKARTVNVSTMASLVAAGAGVPVVKHGNRAATSASGSADVLEALGVVLHTEPADVAKVFHATQITFCFALTFHPSFRHAVPVRRELGVPTAFNVLGPLTNPAQPRASAIGVANRRLAPLVAGVLAGRGASALVFRSEDGLDELTTTAAARIWEVRDGAVAEQVIDFRDVFGLPATTLADLRGQDAGYNARVARDLLDGAAGPIRDAVVLNAAAGLVAYGTLDGTSDGSLTERLGAAVDHARAAIDSGAAREVLKRWVAAGGA